MRIRLLMIVPVLFAIGLTGRSWAGNFLVAPTYPVGNEPVAMVAGDFNNDGNVDIITANSIDKNLSLLLGVGKGKFATTQTLAPPIDTPLGLAAVDLNGDKNLDLIVSGSTASYNGMIAILLGNGNGTFQNPILLAAASTIYQVTVVDINNDKKPDLVVPDGTNVGVYFGNADGTFGAEVLSPTEYYSTTLAVGDFNKDGYPDVSVSDGQYGGTVSILLGNGQGTFTQLIDYQFFYRYVNYILAADLNFDGKLDLLVAEFDDFSVGQVVSMLGNGDGTFQSAVNIGPGSSTMVLTDMNHDGISDLIALCEYSTVDVFLGRSNGTFAHPTGYYGSYNPRAMVVADFNGDGTPDVATANMSYPNSNVTILLASKGGKLQAEQGYALQAESAALTFAGDFNGDGIQDIVVADNFYLGTLYTLLGDGRGGYLPARQSGRGILSPQYGVVADINNDGILDVLTSWTYTSGDVEVFLGKGDGGFNVPINQSVGGSGGPPVLADVNGDGILDLVLPNLSSFSVTIELGNGDGTFKPSQGYLLPDSPGPAAVGDFNGDGKPDIAIASSNAILIMLGNGDGSFGPVRTFQPGSTPAVSVLAADVNGDGFVDLVVSFYASTGLPGVTELLGNGDGTFQKARPIESAISYMGPLTLTDLDGDGIKDLVSLYPGVYWMRGLGGGLFHSPVIINLNAGGAAIADMNSDGKPDMVIEFGTLNGVGVGVALNIIP